MTEHKIMYRGVPVPEDILKPSLFNAPVLSAFKAGVDAVKDQSVQVGSFFTGPIESHVWAALGTVDEVKPDPAHNAEVWGTKDATVDSTGVWIFLNDSERGIYRNVSGGYVNSVFTRDEIGPTYKMQKLGTTYVDLTEFRWVKPGGPVLTADRHDGYKYFRREEPDRGSYPTFYRHPEKATTGNVVDARYDGLRSTPIRTTGHLGMPFLEREIQAGYVRQVERSEVPEDFRAEPFTYFTDEDADPYTYFYRFRGESQRGEVLLGKGASWKDTEPGTFADREDLEGEGYPQIRYADLPDWAK